jgi:hypothetical protein
MSSILDRLEAPDARRWEFEDEGDQLVGEVIALGTYTGEYGESRTVTVMPDVSTTTESGSKVQPGEPLIFYASAKLAADALEAEDPSVGDQIGIRYNGERSSKDGKNSYKLIRIAVQHVSPVIAGLDAKDAATGQDDW